MLSRHKIDLIEAERLISQKTRRSDIKTSFNIASRVYFFIGILAGIVKGMVFMIYIISRRKPDPECLQKEYVQNSADEFFQIYKTDYYSSSAEL